MKGSALSDDVVCCLTHDEFNGECSWNASTSGSMTGSSKQLEAEAREKGVSPSEIVRQALEEHMRKRTPARIVPTIIAKRAGHHRRRSRAARPT